MMVTLPKAFCAQCKCAYKPVQCGEILAAKLTDGRTYYKVHSDLHACPSCDHRIYAGFGTPVEGFATDFDSLRTDQDVLA
jgi:hypothetical protein